MDLFGFTKKLDLEKFLRFEFMVQSDPPWLEPMVLLEQCAPTLDNVDWLCDEAALHEIMQVLIY